MELPEDFVGRFDGIYSVHALNVFKSMEAALDPLIRLKPRWIAFNSLFYNGPLEVLVQIRDYSRSDSAIADSVDGDFNIFSLERFGAYMKKAGFSRLVVSEFQMPQKLPRPENRGRGTYTVQTEFNDRAQFSGPVYLPWHFVLAIRDN